MGGSLPGQTGKDKGTPLQRHLQAQAVEEAWQWTAAKYSPLPPPEPAQELDEDEDEFDEDIEALHMWLHNRFESGIDWTTFLGKLVEVAEDLAQFEEQWCRNQGVSLDYDEKHELHQTIADFVCYRLWPPPPSVTLKDTFGSSDTRAWLIGEGLRLAIRAIREWRDFWFGGDRLDSNTMTELHCLVAALLLLAVEHQLGSPLPRRTVVDCHDGLFLTVERPPSPPEPAVHPSAMAEKPADSM